MSIIHPLKKAWLSQNSQTAAENYDEFQSDQEITDIIKENAHSILRVTMSHCIPGSQNTYDSPESCEQAKKELEQLKTDGVYAEKQNIYYIYEVKIKDRPELSQIGLGCMVDSSMIYDESSKPDGKVIRNEAIFENKARGRAELIRSTECMIGTVNLVTADKDQKLEQKLKSLCAEREAELISYDKKGDEHRVLVVDKSEDISEIEAILDGEEFYVADGNHRSRASQMAGSSAFLAVVFCGRTMNIDPYHRLIFDLPFSDEELKTNLEAENFIVEKLEGEAFYSPEPHQIGMVLKDGWYKLIPQSVNEEDPVESIDSRLLETRLIKNILNWDAADKRIAYVGGDYGPDYLAEKVRSGAARVGLSVPAMLIEQFNRLNEARKMLPRKTTWFTPKIRSGLVIAGLEKN